MPAPKNGNTPTRERKPRRDKRRCIHFVGAEEGLTSDHCGISDGKLHWWGECGGAHGCECYEERKQKGDMKCST